MPWEKSFEVDDAVEAAMRVFWKKGFARTTLTDLTEATGVKRQSLYNAIGDKRELFLQSLRRYDRDHRRSVMERIEALPDPVRAIHILFRGVVEESCHDDAHKGCLLVNTALEMPFHDAEIQLLLKTGLRDFEASCQRLVRRGQELGRIPADLDPDAAAKGLLGLFIGIRVLARGTSDGEELGGMAEQALRLVGRAA